METQRVRSLRTLLVTQNDFRKIDDKPIGQGSYGVVYKVIRIKELNTPKPQILALKIIKKQHFTDESKSYLCGKCR